MELKTFFVTTTLTCDLKSTLSELSEKSLRFHYGNRERDKRFMGNAGRVQNRLERRDLTMLLEKIFPRFLRFCCELFLMGTWRASPSCMGVNVERYGRVLRLGIDNDIVLSLYCMGQYGTRLVGQLPGGKRSFEKNNFIFSFFCFRVGNCSTVRTKVYVNGRDRI